MITLQFGGDADTEALRLEDFLKQLEAIRHAISETQRVLTHGRGPDIHYRVESISRSSPYTAVLRDDAPPSAAAAVARLERAVPDAAEQIQRGHVPEGFDGPALRAYEEMTAAVEDRRSPLVIESRGHTVSLTDELAKRVGVILGPKNFTIGTVTGRLERVNIHGRESAFWVYPTGGPASGVRCRFRRDMLERVSAGVGHYVDVHGRLTYNPIDYYPEEVRAQSIEVYDDDSRFPNMTPLRGIAPEATGDQSAADFLRDLRDEAG